MGSTVTAVDTPQGPGRLYLDLADQPNSLLVLGHGAGGGVGAADLELLATSLPALSTTVARFEQPWRTAGRTAGAPPPKLDEAWRAALDWLVAQEWAQHPLLVGGRSAGARVACRTASDTKPAAIVCLAFPLHRRKHPAGGVAWSGSRLPDCKVLIVHTGCSAPHSHCRDKPIHRSCSGNIDIMTALHITCPYWWTVGTSRRCCVPRHYSRT
jgi:hypothetical protein